MRPATRQSARLAIDTVRQARVSRRRNPRYQRAFHTSVPRSSEPRAPNGHSDQHKAFSEARESQKSDDVESKEAEDVPREEHEPKMTTERKAPLRRTLRQRRLNEVPEPPPIPDWFLSQNVALVKQDRVWDFFHSTKKSLLRCVDRETGHTIFTIPNHDLADLNAKLRSDGKNAHQTVPVGDLPVGERQEPASKKSELKVDFFDSKYNTDDRLMEDFVPGDKKPWNEQSLRSDYWKHPFLEIEASVRAALALSSMENRSSSFILDRVDVSLQCPDPQSHDKMDDFLADLAHVVRIPMGKRLSSA